MRNNFFNPNLIKKLFVKLTLICSLFSLSQYAVANFELKTSTEASETHGKAIMRMIAGGSGIYCFAKTAVMHNAMPMGMWLLGIIIYEILARNIPSWQPLT